MTVTKEFHFEAAHSLPHLPEGHKCRRPHGHSYRFRVEVDGEMDERGFVIDYAEIKAAVKPIVKRLDHYDLDEIFDFYTTAENLAVWLYHEIPLDVSRIVFFETRSTSVIYEGEATTLRGSDGYSRQIRVNYPMAAQKIETEFSDRERLDWLESKDVVVRTPLRYGSAKLFCGECVTEEDEAYRINLRNQIDEYLRP